VTEPGRVAREFKRRVGDPTPILLGGSPIGAELLMARMLKWAVNSIQSTEGTTPASIAVTHPANWGEYKLDLLRQAIRHVGVTVDHYVPEPAAAASYYAAQRDVPDGSIVAVYDLGGGTFDAALVKREGNSFRIIGRPDGIERLGGIDFDHAIINYVADNLGLELDYPPPAEEGDPAMLAGLTQLRQDCIEAKEALSSETDVSIPVLLPNRHTEVRLTRLEFEAMVRPAINETIVALRRTIESAGIALDTIAAVLLVGGSSRIPMVGHMVSEQLRRPVAIDANPKDAISSGAALLAWRAARPAPPKVTDSRPAPPVDPRPAPPTTGRPTVPLAAAAGLAGAAAASAATSPQARPAPPTQPTAPTRPTAPILASTPQPQAPPRPQPPRPAPPVTAPAPMDSGQRPAAAPHSPTPTTGFPHQPPAPPQGPGSGPYGMHNGGGPSNPQADQNRNWIIGGAVAIAVLLLIAIIVATQGGGDDNNPDEATDNTTEVTDPTDDTTDDTATDDTVPGDVTGGLDLSEITLSELPGDDWGDEAQAQFQSDCELVVDAAAEEFGEGLTFDSPEICGCTYDDVSTSGITLADFNEMWTASEVNPSSEAGAAFTTSLQTCMMSSLGLE
jgi:actin-like ATPase involved in cell morphogenesis